MVLLTDPSTNRMTMNLFLTDFSYIDFNNCKKYDRDFVFKNNRFTIAQFK